MCIRDRYFNVHVVHVNKTSRELDDVVVLVDVLGDIHQNNQTYRSAANNRVRAYNLILTKNSEFIERSISE